MVMKHQLGGVYDYEALGPLRKPGDLWLGSRAVRVQGLG